MKLEQSLKIQSKSDYCHVARTGSGNVQIGSISIEQEEVEDFIKCLREAVSLLPLNEPKEN